MYHIVDPILHDRFLSLAESSTHSESGHFHIRNIVKSTLVSDLLVAIHNASTLSCQRCGLLCHISPDEQETGDEEHDIEKDVQTEVSRESSCSEGRRIAGKSGEEETY